MNSAKIIRILEFGYDTDSGRSSLLLETLGKNGFLVSSLLVDPAARAKRLRFLLNVFTPQDADIVFLRFPYFPWMARCAVWLKKRLNAPLVVDAMLSSYETEVEDRRWHAPGSPGARKCADEDALIGREAAILITDTNAHSRYLGSKFHCGMEKMLTVPVGSPLFERYYHRVASLKACHQDIRVLYMGSFVPLHGIGTVIEAARILAAKTGSITFKLVGNGQDYQLAQNMAAGITTLEFVGTLPPAAAIAEFLQADIILGIFGSSNKAKLVVPFKAYDALAFGKPLVTARTPAAEEILTHGRDAWLVESSAASLADGIRQLAADAALRNQLGFCAQQTYQSHYHTSVTIRPLINRLATLVESQV